MVSIRHSTLSAARPSGGIGATMWDEVHEVTGLVIGDVAGLQAALDAKQAVTTVLTNTTASFTTAQETKLAGIATGATANAADSALRDRSTHTGTQAISTVTGLQAALDGKQATLVSGTSLKTVNGNSLLGSGDITISGGGSASWGGITGTLSAQTDLQTALNARQPLATVLTNTTAAFTTAQETKLAGIASGATANATDAQLRDRSTHTGTQAISTVSGLQAALDGKVASNPTGITGADAITNIVSLTQAEYDAIGTKSPTTFYVVTA